MTQQQLANKVGVTRQRVAAFENGTRNAGGMSLDVAVRFCDALRVFCVKLPNRRCVVISDADFGRWGEAAERGDYGGNKGPVMHGPIFPVDADYPDTVSLGVSADMETSGQHGACRKKYGRHLDDEFDS